MTKLERLFVWTGGALFAASLAVCAGWYVLVLGRPARAAGGWPALAFDAALLTLFAAHHSVFARTRVQTWIGRAVPQRLVRSTYVWTSSLLLVTVCVLWRRIGGVVYDVGGAGAVTLGAAEVGGIAIIAGAVARIDPLELAGIRTRSGPETLQVTGPYRWVRHPVYLGWMIAIFATPRLTVDRLAFAALSSAYLALAVPWEERTLARRAGEAYERYRAQVRWRLVPFIY